MIYRQQKQERDTGRGSVKDPRSEEAQHPHIKEKVGVVFSEMLDQVIEQNSSEIP